MIKNVLVALVLLTSAVASADATGNINSLKNVSFEDGSEYFAYYWNAPVDINNPYTARRSDDLAMSGSYSMEFQPDPAVGWNYVWTSAYQDVDVSTLSLTGEQLTVSTNGYNSSANPLLGNVRVNLKITLFDSSDTFLDQGLEIAMSNNSATDTWIAKTASVVAPAGVAWIRYELQLFYKYDGRDVGGAVYFDDMSTNLPDPTFMLGDANHDGVVSASDYMSVQSNFGNTGAIGILGDANGDGIVSAGDFVAVQTNYGNVVTAGYSAAPVPEPATIGLLTLGVFGLIRRRLRA